MSRILQLKHWQLFLLLIGLPVTLEFISIIAIIIMKNPMILIVILPVVMILSIVVFFGWFYALGVNLHKKLPETVIMNLTLFKVFLFIPVVYISFLSFFIFGVFKNAAMNEGPPDPGIIALIVPVHLFSMFCIFYCLYFIAKSMKSVEWQKPVTFNDYAGEFFLIWFFPVGVWIIQPRINKIFATKEEIPSDFLS